MKKIMIPMLGLGTLLGCDQQLLSEREALELEELDAADDLSEEPDENLWEGLTQEEIAQLEYADGTDIEAPAESIDDLTAMSDATKAAPPPCIWLLTWNDGIRNHAQATNLCESLIPHRFKMIWAWGSDGTCRSYFQREVHRESRLIPGHVVRLESC